MRYAIASTMLAVLIAGCARTPADTARAAEAQQATQDALRQQLAGLVPGRAQTCLPNTLPGAGVQTRGYGATILYIAGRDLIYRNDTTGGCQAIARGDILVTRQALGRACSGDIATTVDQTTGFVTGSCGLRDFIPYKRPR